MVLHFDPAERTALVTGASSGIGAALARALASQGARLVITARRRERLEALGREIAAAGGRPPCIVEGDLAADDGPEHVFAAARAAVGPIDLLVNNAGIGYRGHFDRRGVAAADSLLRLNIDAVVRLAALALPDMLERRHGAVLNVASTAAFMPLPRMAVYAASKAFVLSWSLTLHEELRPQGVLVTCLCPGRTTETEFSSRTGFSAPDTPAAIAPGSLRARLRAHASQPAAEVAIEAIGALRAGRHLVIAGRHNRLVVALARHLPPALVARLAGRVTRV